MNLASEHPEKIAFFLLCKRRSINVKSKSEMLIKEANERIFSECLYSSNAECSGKKTIL
jgi:hypothetical protein